MATKLMTGKSKIYHHWKLFPMEFWRWENFTPKELACKGTKALMIDFDAMDKLQELRERLDRAMTLNSAFRSVIHNRKCGGAARSFHLRAQAFDNRMKKFDRREFEYEARESGFTGFGFYPEQNFIHIDTGPARQWGQRW